jgi:hypothetical protein
MTRWQLLGAIAGLAACTVPAPDEIRSAVPAPSSFLAAIKPADLGRSVEAVQLVTVRRGDKAITVELRLSINGDRLILVAQDMLGQRLMTVRWDDRGVHEERSPNLPDLVSPTGILADLVAICWPAELVKRALASTGADLVEQQGERLIVLGRQSTLHATIGWGPTRWTGTLSYRNLRAGYTVDVQSVEQP